MIVILPKKDYWVGVSAWRHRTNAIYVGLFWWVICVRVEYDSPWYQVIKRLPLS